LPATKIPVSAGQAMPHKEIQKTHAVVVLLLFLLAPILSGVVWFFLIGVYDVYKLMLGPSEMFVGPPGVAFGIPAMLAGIVGCYWPIKFVMRKLLKDRYDSYVIASARQYRMDSDRAMRGMAALFLPVFIFGCFAVFHSKIIFLKDRMSACGFLSCTEHNYEEISEIGFSTRAKAPNGNIVARRDFYLRFKDGSAWSPYILSGELERQSEVANFLSGKTGLNVVTVDILPE
jgi:hypothetical protein